MLKYSRLGKSARYSTLHDPGTRALHNATIVHAPHARGGRFCGGV